MSGSVTDRLGDSVRVWPVTNRSVAAAATVGASLTAVMPMVVVWAALRLNEPLPSLTTQVTVRVGFEP